MTSRERKLCRDLVVTPSGVAQISNEEFLCQFPSSVDGGKLALRVLDEAYRAQSAEDLQCALIIGFVFGFSPEHKDILLRLIDVDWHYSHENVVLALQTWPTPDTVEALFRATQWIPSNLSWDINRALAVKAIWGLGSIPGKEAETKLEALTHSEDAILRENATEQLELRRESR